MTTTDDASPEDLASEVEKALAKEPPKRVTRYWAEVMIALFVVAIIALGVIAGQRTERTYVLAHDTPKGTPLDSDDLKKARLPHLDGALTSKDDIRNLVAAEDLMGATPLRRKNVLRLQAITTSAIHGGDPISPANVAFQLTAFVPDALTKVSDLGGVARHSIPAGMIVRKPMLETDASIIGTARRELAPFVLLLDDDVAFRKPRFDRAVLVRAIAKGGAVRARDLVAMPADGAEVVGSYHVICGPIHPLAGTHVLLVSGGKETGEAIEATLLALQTSGETSTAVVALHRADALKLAKEGAEPVHLVQAIGGSR